MSIESVMPSNHLILCRPLLPLPSTFPSVRVFSSESALRIRWPKYWSFSFSISPFSEYSGLISFRIDWFDLLAVQGTLKSLLQHHSSKASILQCSAFFRSLMQANPTGFLKNAGRLLDSWNGKGNGWKGPSSPVESECTYGSLAAWWSQRMALNLHREGPSETGLLG